MFELYEWRANADTGESWWISAQDSSAEGSAAADEYSRGERQDPPPGPEVRSDGRTATIEGQADVEFGFSGVTGILVNVRVSDGVFREPTRAEAEFAFRACLKPGRAEIYLTELLPGEWDGRWLRYSRTASPR